jgi:hypothetical protein
VKEKVVDGLVVRTRRCLACSNKGEFVTIERPAMPQDMAALRAADMMAQLPNRMAMLGRAQTEAKSDFMSECVSAALTSLNQGKYADVEDMLKAISCGLGEIQDTLRTCRTHTDQRSRRTSSSSSPSRGVTL